MNEHFEAELWDITKRRAELSFERCAKHCESPIETAFLVALCMSIRLWRDDPLFVLGPGLPTPKEQGVNHYYYVKPQAQIGKHRVDFLFGHSDLMSEAVVECDGREFHHSTREQIERDRARDSELEAADYRVFRFPGTQVHHSAFECAYDIIIWAEGVQS